MDPVRISHLRQFANALSLTVQGHATHQQRGQEHMQNMLGVFARSAVTAQFIANSALAAGPSSALPQRSPVMVAAMGPANLKTPSALQAVTPSEKSLAAATATAMVLPGVVTAARQPEAAVLSHPLLPQTARHFFTKVPWSGQAAVPAALSPLSTATVPAPALDTSVLASRFFASLPWASQALGGKLSIGSGLDNLEKAQRLSDLTGRSAATALTLPSHLQPQTNFGTATAAGFFKKLPWSGAGTVAQPLH